MGWDLQDDPDNTAAPMDIEANITSASKVKLRASACFNELGRFTKGDLLNHPWKALPILIPIPSGGFFILATAGIAAATIVYHSFKKDFRARFQNAARGELDTHLASQLLEDYKDGQKYAPMRKIFKYHAAQIYLHGNHIIHLNLDKLSDGKFKTAIQRWHQKMSKFNPARFEITDNPKDQQIADAQKPSNADCPLPSSQDPL